MSVQRILIVEDQRDARRVLRAGLETLGQGISVTDVPSGEEALLVISHQPVDLLISDVRLPGISGLELKQRALARNPALKLILVTGTADPQIRQEVVNAGVDAFFFKPVDVTEFLEAVRRCLSLAESIPPAAPGSGEVMPPLLTFSNRLSSLRRDLDLICTVLLDNRGRVLAKAGDLPGTAWDANLVAAMMALFRAGAGVSQFLGSKSPDDLLHLRGAANSLFWVHVGQSMVLLCVTGPGSTRRDQFGKIQAALQQAGQDFLSVQEKQGLPSQLLDDSQVSSPENKIEPGAMENVPDVDTIFQQTLQDAHEPEDLDAFWERLSEMDESPGEMNGEMLSYEQARRLGLLPDSDQG